MSAAMFQQSKPETAIRTPPESKIPVPASPTPFRRCSSVRLRGERGSSVDLNGTTLIRAGTIVAKDRHLQDGAHHQEGDGDSSPFRRGNSFMERGEKQYGGGSSSSRTNNGSSRPQSVRIRNQQLQQSKASPESPGRIRSLSLSLTGTRINSPKSPTVSGTSPNNLVSSGTSNYSTGHLDCWDSESVTSIGSSVASCDHATIARNGTTFSGRSMKYVFHCNQHSGISGEEYLTPTQRAHRQVKKLKYLLYQAKKDLEKKDSDILKLTKEVVELRLYKAALGSPEDKSQSNSSDAVTVRENSSEKTTPEKDEIDHLSPTRFSHEPNGSLADSGNFEDGTNSSIHSKDSVMFEDLARSPFRPKSVEMLEKGITAHIDILETPPEQKEIIIEYEKRIQELIKMHEEETYQLKQKHNDKVEELLQRITEINTRYWQLVPELETAKERIKELVQQLEEASKKLEEQESQAKETYLKMYAQGQEAARVEHENSVMEIARQNPSRVSVPELLQELQVTKNELEKIRAMYRQLMEAKSKNKIDPEVTLQFLKSAIYYFLTDRENSQGHLKAIQSILGFSANEISNIDKARLA